MKIVKRLLRGLGVAALVLILIGMVLPDRAQVKRSTVIQAPPSEVFALINDFREFNKWSPWFARDPNMQIAFTGPATGLGSKMSWRSNHSEVGTGTQQIIASEPHSLVRTHLDFGQQGAAIAEFRLTPRGNDATEVTWGFDAEFGWDLVGRYFGLLLDAMIGPDYEKGLTNLKSLAEARN